MIERAAVALLKAPTPLLTLQPSNASNTGLDAPASPDRHAMLEHSHAVQPQAGSGVLLLLVTNAATFKERSWRSRSGTSHTEGGQAHERRCRNDCYGELSVAAHCSCSDYPAPARPV